MYGTEDDNIHVKTFHTMFPPVYIIESRLQASGGAVPQKWEPRSRMGIYLGHSPFHDGSVALVLNPLTGRFSPQYHVVFDEEFPLSHTWKKEQFNQIVHPWLNTHLNERPMKISV